MNYDTSRGDIELDGQIYKIKTFLIIIDKISIKIRKQTVYEEVYENVDLIYNITNCAPSKM